MEERSGLQVYLLDQAGGSRPGEISEFDRVVTSGNGLAWVILDYTRDEARDWLRNSNWLNPVVKQNLADDDSRPRCLISAEGVFLSLRGVNHNRDAEPEDMVGVRLWVTPNGVVSSKRRALRSLTDIQEALESGTGPVTASAFLSVLVQRLALRSEAVIDGIEESLEALEDDPDLLTGPEGRRRLSELRRRSIRLRRYFAPQKEALSQLLSEAPAWVGARDKLHLRESNNSFKRYLEELDSIRDRAIVAQEELLGRLSETLNRRMYVLSLVAAVFLPLGFLTGLLGINVGGIPGAENPRAFALVCLIVGVVVTVLLAVFKYKRWF